MAVIKEYRGRAPRLESPAFLAETAAIVGDVTLKRGTSVYYSAVLRADSGSITVGENTNIQDGAVLHTAAGHDVCVGCGVSIGHCALVHGCTVEDGALIGMHATVLSGAHIGTGSVVAAGALVTEGMAVPPNSVVMGVPGRVRGPVTPQLAARVKEGAAWYAGTAPFHAAGQPAPARAARPDKHFEKTHALPGRPAR